MNLNWYDFFSTLLWITGMVAGIILYAGIIWFIISLIVWFCEWTLQ